jgi:hypothetical protein
VARDLNVAGSSAAQLSPTSKTARCAGAEIGRHRREPDGFADELSVSYFAAISAVASTSIR